MDPTAMKENLIAVLGQIQTESELECPLLTGVTKPLEDIPQFDSKIWPIATTYLASATGATIPDDVNIFVDKTTKQPHSIDDVAAFVCDLLLRIPRERTLRHE